MKLSHLNFATDTVDSHKPSVAFGPNEIIYSQVNYMGVLSQLSGEQLCHMLSLKSFKEICCENGTLDNMSRLNYLVKRIPLFSLFISYILSPHYLFYFP